LRGVKTRPQFHVVTEAWHLLVTLLGEQSSGRLVICCRSRDNPTSTITKATTVAEERSVLFY
ncbi:MAG: hypothetical protein ACRD39_07275, partial [Nitrososphaeraceae archaeon]